MKREKQLNLHLPLPLAGGDVDHLLRNWHQMNSDVTGLTTQAVAQLIRAEVKGKKRVSVLLRLHGRLNKVRADQERRALVSGQLPHSLEVL